MAGGAARPVASATDEDAGPVADDNAEGPVARGGDAARSLADDSAEEPVAGGRCEACGRCCRCRAPVTHVFTTAWHEGVRDLDNGDVGNGVQWLLQAI